MRVKYAKVVDLLVDAVKELNVPCGAVVEPVPAEPSDAERRADTVDWMRGSLNNLESNLESHGADAADAAAEHGATFLTSSARLPVKVVKPAPLKKHALDVKILHDTVIRERAARIKAEGILRNAQKEKAGLQKALDAAQTEIAELQTEAELESDCQTKLDETLKRLEAAQNEVGQVSEALGEEKAKLQMRLNNANAEKADLETSLRKAMTEIAVLETALEKEQAELTQLAIQKKKQLAEKDTQLSQKEEQLDEKDTQLSTASADNALLQGQLAAANTAALNATQANVTFDRKRIVGDTLHGSDGTTTRGEWVSTRVFAFVQPGDEAFRQLYYFNDADDAFSGETPASFPLPTAAGAIEENCHKPQGKWTGNLRGEAGKVFAQLADASEKLAALAASVTDLKTALGNAQQEKADLETALGNLEAAVEAAKHDKETALMDLECAKDQDKARALAAFAANVTFNNGLKQIKDDAFLDYSTGSQRVSVGVWYDVVDGTEVVPRAFAYQQQGAGTTAPWQLYYFNENGNASYGSVNFGAVLNATGIKDACGRPEGVWSGNLRAYVEHR